MCNIKRIKEEKESLTSSINSVLNSSGATIVITTKKIENLEKEAMENIEQLSFLL